MTATTTLRNDATTPDYKAIKSKQQVAWGSGDYGKVGVTLQLVGEELCESVNLKPGLTVLDVAAGNGNATMAAARRFSKVTSTDYVQSLLDQSRQRAIAEGFHVKYQQADAENLPFEDSSFDYVVSTYGVMFAPDQESAAAELIRVCKPGGKIGLANWTPEGFIGQLFKTLGAHISPPAGLNSPARWGTEDFLQTQFRHQATDISNTVKQFSFRYESIDHWLDVFGNYYGPVHKAFEALEGEDGARLRNDVRTLLNTRNIANDGTLNIPSDYLETVVTL